MSWCPKCKTEYRKGIEVCSDCGSKLVESLSEVKDNSNLMLMMSGDEFQINMIADELRREGFESVVVKPKDAGAPKGTVVPYDLYISPEESRDAVTFAAEFMRNTNPQAEEIIKNPDTQRVIMQKSEPNKEFVTAKERGSDMMATGIMLLIFGIAGFIFMVLVILQIIPIRFVGFNAVIAYSVIVIFFGSLLVGGITSLISAKKLKNVTNEETKQFDELEEWVKNNLSKNILEELFHADEIGEEQLYFERMDYMKKELSGAFPELSEDMLDYYLEKTYAEYFE